MFLKAISAHIRGLIKPNRVELWLILSQRGLSYQSGPRNSVQQLPGITTMDRKRKPCHGSTLLWSLVCYQPIRGQYSVMLANQKAGC